MGLLHFKEHESNSDLLILDISGPSIITTAVQLIAVTTILTPDEGKRIDKPQEHCCLRMITTTLSENLIHLTFGFAINLTASACIHRAQNQYTPRKNFVTDHSIAVALYQKN